MDDNSLNVTSLLNGLHSGSQAGRSKTSCDDYETISYHSIHGPPSAGHNCFEDCYVCAELAMIDDKISEAYAHLLDVIQIREKIIKKPHNDTPFDRAPVEMLSSIFCSVKQTYDEDSHKNMFSQPYRSPPLLVGAVCKKWRDITLQTPQLWTNVVVDLGKPESGQHRMVNEWALRSGALPVNLTVFHHGDCSEYLYGLPDECKGLVEALRSLAGRWNNVALQAPWTFYDQLLDELQEPSPIVSFHSQIMDRIRYVAVSPIKPHHPLRPRYFYSHEIMGKVELSFEWDNLVDLQVYYLGEGELLHILRCAPNLSHCDINGGSSLESEDFPIPTTPIINYSLVHLRTKINIMNSSTLPSLQHLEYLNARVGDIDSLVEFVRRSDPPLQTFILHCDINPNDHYPRFEKLGAITHLSVNDFSLPGGNEWIVHFLHCLIKHSSEVILPCLKEFVFDLPYMSLSSWSLFTDMLSHNTQMDTPGLEGRMASVTHCRPLSKAHILVRNDNQYLDPMWRDTFMELLAVKKLGMDLDLRLGCGVDLFRRLAEFYFVEL